MTELKSCPFCGADAKIIRKADEDGDTYFHVCCLGCYAETDGYNTRDHAAEAWNRRAE